MLIYDNLTTAVRRVLQGKNRILQESYLKFQGYYNFTPRFCNPSKGNEKGGVEGLVGFARRNYRVPMPESNSFNELNEKILQEILSYGNHRITGRDKTVNENFEEEKSSLIHLPPHPYSNIRISIGKVDKYSTVIVDKNRYSVPTKYTGLPVNVQVSVDTVELFRSGHHLAHHVRLYGNNKWSLNPDHYLELIQRRPQSFESARPIQQWPPCLESLLDRFCQKQGHTNGVKDFISVLMFYRQHTPDEVQAAVELALEIRAGTSDDVKHLLLQTKKQIPTEPLKDWPRLPVPDLSVYDPIGGRS